MLLLDQFIINLKREELQTFLRELEPPSVRNRLLFLFLMLLFEKTVILCLSV